MTDDRVKQATKVLTGTAAIAALVKAEYDEAHGEYKSVTFAGIPLFSRNEAGTPRVLGIPFGRWIRGRR